MDAIKTRAKTRALKKYEAAPIAHATAPGDPPLNLFSPFGPLIAQAAIPQSLVDRINRYADAHVRENGGGEFLLPKELVFDGGEESLIAQTEKLIRRYLGLIDEATPGRITLSATDRRGFSCSAS